MARAVKTGAREGTQSSHVKDATKYTCPNCDGTEFMISTTLDEADDIIEDTVHAALLLTNAGSYDTLGLVAQCSQCGHESVPWWIMLDVVSNVNSKAFTMTDMVQATTADLAEGLYCIPLDNDGTDIGLVYIVATNTKADPTVLTMTIASPDNSEVGFMLVTNLSPTGWTLAS